MARSTTNRFRKVKQSSDSNVDQPEPPVVQNKLKPVPIDIQLPVARETRSSRPNQTSELPKNISTQYSTSLPGASRPSQSDLPVAQESASYEKSKSSSRRRKVVLPLEKVEMKPTSKGTSQGTSQGIESDTVSSTAKPLPRGLHRGSRFYTAIPDTSQDRLGEVVLPKIPRLSHSQPEYPKTRLRWGIYPKSIFQKLSILTVLVLFGWYRYQIYRLGYCDKHIETPKGSYFDYLLPHCLSCPLHGECKNGEFLGCNEGYSSLAHPLNTPLLPFPPTCINDIAPIKKVDGFTKLAIGLLSRRLGYHQCYDSSAKSGLTRQELYQNLIRFKDVSLSHEAFEELFRRTVDQLELSSDLVTTFDGDTFVAKFPSFNNWCRVKIYVLSKLRQYQNELLLLGFSLLLFAYLWKRYRQYQQDIVIAKKCISHVLRMLMEKDHLHLLYPNLHQESSISIVHARDQLLARKYPSLKTRERIWKHVIAQIETNANVRTYQHEFRGDAHRVWEWVGETQPFLRKPTKLSRELNSLEFGSNSPLNSHDEEGEVSG